MTALAHASPQAALKAYIDAVDQAHHAGNATEHTYRPALKTLIEAIAGPGICATNEPTRRTDCGAPDMIVARGTVPLGYIEAKDISIDLKKTTKTDQLKRYFEALPNLILTDYLSFRWYVEGELRLSADFPQPGRDGRIRFSAAAASELEQLLQQFLAADIPHKTTPKGLATGMAGIARLIRDSIKLTFEKEGSHGDLHVQLDAFRKVLIDTLEPEQFADMYAQTLCYGLFAARCNSTEDGFKRQSAADALPKTNPFLRKLFHTIAGPDLDDRIAWAVDQLAVLLSRSDMTAILEEFGRRTRQEDPVVHFYETFLADYDPKLRETRGVYYTPEPVVGYIVRSVDVILKRDFKMRDGLADSKKIKIKRQAKNKNETEQVETHRLQILDPATGTGTFLYKVIANIREHFQNDTGAWPGYVTEHLLPRIFGFELLMAPYAVAHMKLGLELQDSGYDFARDERLGVFLTNSLEEAHEYTGMPLFGKFLTEESGAAGDVKRDAPVMVVLGNPPYSGHSVNTGKWIADLLRGYDSLTGQRTENYFEVDGQPLGERNPKWLNDDYVKFIRFAQWRIEQTGHGILAFVTNHGYLDNPTFRGMRESLLKSFDQIYLLDLHGNSKKKERAPDGGKDENVFDIQQGVAIGIFVKQERSKSKKVDAKNAQVFHADLYGARADKYAALDENEIATTDWKEVAPTSPNYYFVPQNGKLRKEYEKGWKITDAMPVNVLGFQTHRDGFAVDFDRDRLSNRISELRNQELLDAELISKYSLKQTKLWKVASIRTDVRNDQFWENKIIKCSYRPFDNRWIFYSDSVVDRTRRELVDHVIGKENTCLNVTRITKDHEWRNAVVSDKTTPAVYVEIKEGSTVLPLWLYPHESDDLVENGKTEKSANFAPEFIESLTTAIGRSPSPEDTIAYIYAILYSPEYRLRYADFLKRDFPRIPLTTGRELFARLVEIGHELIGLHTMETELDKITNFPEQANNEVEKIRFVLNQNDNAATTPTFGRVYINDVQYFDKVPRDVWETHIGGYRVAEKWLKDRKGRVLKFDDIYHYHNIIAALARTLELQVEIDAATEAAGGWPLK